MSRPGSNGVVAQGLEAPSLGSHLVGPQSSVERLKWRTFTLSHDHKRGILLVVGSGLTWGGPNLPLKREPRICQELCKDMVVICASIEALTWYAKGRA